MHPPPHTLLFDDNVPTNGGIRGKQVQFTNLEDFHGAMAHVMDVPGGVYSFFNGLAPDNLRQERITCM